MKVHKIFDKLWLDYVKNTPSAGRIHELFTKEGEQIENDHVAFRTFNDPRVSIEVLAEPFIAEGYVERGEYYFAEKHLEARHFELPGDLKAPRVFISQLILADFSNFLVDAVTRLIDTIQPFHRDPGSLIFAGEVFGTPWHETYLKLRNESEYAAWLYVFGYRANHFTVDVNALKKFNDLEEVNNFLKKNGFELNSSGGEIKGTKTQLLRQSSILADKVTVNFKEGDFVIPSCYYEFAQRYKDKDGNLFSGFIAGSADKIFESADFRE